MAQNSMLIRVGLSESDLFNMLAMCEASIKFAECCDATFHGSVDIVAHRAIASSLQHRFRSALDELLTAKRKEEAIVAKEKQASEKKPEPAAAEV